MIGNTTIFLTPEAIDQLKPPFFPHVEVFLQDSELPGFGLRCNLNGHKHFIIRYFCEGKEYTECLGPAGASLDIETARRLARQRILNQTSNTAPQIPAESSSQVEGLVEISSRCREDIPVDRFYRQLHDLGFHYDPAFKTITSLRRGSGEALGRISLRNLRHLNDGLFHDTAFLDACFQVTHAAMGNLIARTYVPMKIGRIWHSTEERIDNGWAYAKLRSLPLAAQDVITADLRLFDETGRILMIVEELGLRGLNREASIPEACRSIESRIDTVRQAENSATAQTATSEHLLNQLRTLSPDLQFSLVCDLVRKIVSSVLQIDSVEKISVTDIPRDFGADSLSTMEIARKLRQEIHPLILPALSPIALLTMNIGQIGDLVLSAGGFPQGSADFVASTAKLQWLVCSKPVARPRARLFCFHHLGGSATAFSGWHAYLPDWLEIHAIQLPGREERSNEICITDFRELEPLLIEAVSSFLSRPFFLFGHSMGTLIGYNAALAIADKYGCKPLHLFASGFWPPQSHWIERIDADKAWASASELEIPDGLAGDSIFMNMMASIVHSDAELVKSYGSKVCAVPDFPITVFRGTDDPMFTAVDAEGWKTSTTAEVNLHTLPGAHMFIIRNQSLLLKQVSRIIWDCLRDGIDTD